MKFSTKRTEEGVFFDVRTWVSPNKGGKEGTAHISKWQKKIKQILFDHFCHLDTEIKYIVDIKISPNVSITKKSWLNVAIFIPFEGYLPTEKLVGKLRTQVGMFEKFED